MDLVLKRLFDYKEKQFLEKILRRLRLRVKSSIRFRILFLFAWVMSWIESILGKTTRVVSWINSISWETAWVVSCIDLNLWQSELISFTSGRVVPKSSLRHYSHAFGQAMSTRVYLQLMLMCAGMGGASQSAHSVPFQAHHSLPPFHCSLKCLTNVYGTFW